MTLLANALASSRLTQKWEDDLVEANPLDLDQVAQEDLVALMRQVREPVAKAAILPGPDFPWEAMSEQSPRSSMTCC